VSRRFAYATIVGVALGGCAPLPPAADEPARAPAPVTRREAPPMPSARASAIARHVDLARASSESGDIARSAEHWHIVTLLDPGNGTYRSALEAAQEAIRRGVSEQLGNGAAARKSGDAARARDAYLRALALDPDNAEAMRALREIELQAMTRTQGDRAARVRGMDEVVANAKNRTANGVDLDLPLELVRAGDLNAGLRELRAWVDANPNDRAGRQRAGAAVAERAKDAEAKGQRERALSLYADAAQLRGDSLPEWTSRSQALRKALGEEYYNEGMKAYRSDLAVAIRHLETSIKYDPGNLKAQGRLREAKLAQQKLRMISPK
jgi:tetratricopeptide (TPR) repeat protein